MIVQTASELTYDIQERIAAALAAADWDALEISIDRDGSAQSASRYLDIRFEDEAGDELDPFCIRISDHEARSYYRAGDWSIALNAGDGNAALCLPFEEVVETTEREVEVLDTDENDDLVARVQTWGEEEFVGYRTDADAVEAAVAAAVARVRRHVEANA